MSTQCVIRYYYGNSCPVYNELKELVHECTQLQQMYLSNIWSAHNPAANINYQANTAPIPKNSQQHFQCI